MSQYSYLNRGILINRWIFTLRFNFKEPLRIGIGSEGVLNPIMKIFDGVREKPFIPAESVRGPMRSIYTQILKGYSEFLDEPIKKVVRSHKKDIHVDLEEYEKDLDKIAEELEGIDDIRKILEGLKEDDIRGYYEVIASSICPICSLFGSRYLNGRIMFKDVWIDTPTDTYTSTSIDRKSETVKEGHLVTIEYIPPVKKYFEIEFTITNLSGDEIKYLKLVILYLHKVGFDLGSRNSVGFGRLKLDLDESKITILEFKSGPNLDEEEVKMNIMRLVNPSKYGRKISCRELIEDML